MTDTGERQDRGQDQGRDQRQDQGRDQGHDKIEYRLGELEKGLGRLNDTVNGDGLPGIKQNLATFRADWEHREGEKKLFDDQQDEARLESGKRLSMRLSNGFKLIGLLLAIVGTTLALITFFHKPDEGPQPARPAPVIQSP